jgi:hypothetical protein
MRKRSLGVILFSSPFSQSQRKLFLPFLFFALPQKYFDHLLSAKSNNLFNFAFGIHLEWGWK